MELNTTTNANFFDENRKAIMLLAGEGTTKMRCDDKNEE